MAEGKSMLPSVVPRGSSELWLNSEHGPPDLGMWKLMYGPLSLHIAYGGLVSLSRLGVQSRDLWFGFDRVWSPLALCKSRGEFRPLLCNSPWELHYHQH